MKMFRCAKCQRRRPRKKLYGSPYGGLFCWALDKCTGAWVKNVETLDKQEMGLHDYAFMKVKARDNWDALQEGKLVIEF